jgi:hypothetical protein
MKKSPNCQRKKLGGHPDVRGFRTQEIRVNQAKLQNAKKPASANRRTPFPRLLRQDPETMREPLLAAVRES